MKARSRATGCRPRSQARRATSLNCRAPTDRPPIVPRSSPAIDRTTGLDQGISDAPNLAIVRSQTGDFTRTQGEVVMESLPKAEGGADICAPYADNDNMSVGAIQAIKEAGLKPGQNIKIMSIDSMPNIHLATRAGEAHATVELTPNIAGPFR